MWHGFCKGRGQGDPTMRMHKQARTMMMKKRAADLGSVMKQLTEEFPAVPDDVIGLILQAARQDLAANEDPAVMLPKMRRILGESLLMEAMHEAEPAPRPDVALAW